MGRVWPVVAHVPERKEMGWVRGREMRETNDGVTISGKVTMGSVGLIDMDERYLVYLGTFILSLYIPTIEQLSALPRPLLVA